MTMQNPSPFDFWYAVNNTEIVVRPRQHLETFGTTTLHYHLVAETMDAVNQIRVREGRIQAFRPQIITPDNLGGALLEGFGEEQAGHYLDWLRENQSHLVLLKYGFAIRKETINEHVVTDAIENVLDRVKAEVEASSHPMHALIRGVDEPWEVCLLQLITEVIQQSALANARDLQQDPDGSRHRIEGLFRQASRNASHIPELSNALKQAGLFKEFEDRFFALVRAAAR
ncbi:MAG TPA: hypothetical protein PKA51_01260 [Kiritimatiellia bacterium]|nr:hypothetical protein [Kiritimatiellia bacterium]